MKLLFEKAGLISTTGLPPLMIKDRNPPDPEKTVAEQIAEAIEVLVEYEEDVPLKRKRNNKSNNM